MPPAALGITWPSRPGWGGMRAKAYADGHRGAKGSRPSSPAYVEGFCMPRGFPLGWPGRSVRRRPGPRCMAKPSAPRPIHVVCLNTHHTIYHPTHWLTATPILQYLSTPLFDSRDADDDDTR
jgi:hypothetical protein